MLPVRLIFVYLQDCGQASIRLLRSYPSSTATGKRSVMLSCTARPIAISISRTKSYLSDYAVWSVFWHHLHYGLLRATLSVFLFHGLFHKYNCWKYLSFLFAALFETQENLQISYMINNRSNGKRRSSRDFFALVQMDDSYFLSR